MKAPLGGAGEGKNSDSVAQGPDVEGNFSLLPALSLPYCDTLSENLKEALQQHESE